MAFEHFRAYDQARAIDRLTQILGGHLRGRPPEEQGAALADLLATWLAGHLVKGDPAATAELRQGLLDMHLAQVAELVALHHKRIHGDG